MNADGTEFLLSFWKWVPWQTHRWNAFRREPTKQGTATPRPPKSFTGSHLPGGAPTRPNGRSC